MKNLSAKRANLEKCGEYGIIRSSTVSQVEVLSIIHAHENRSNNNEVRVLKEGRKSTVYLLPVSLGEEEKMICLKHYPFQGGVTSLKNIFLPSRAMSAFKAAETFRHLGITTAKPLAVVEKRRGLLLTESILVMEDISQHLGFPEYLDKNFFPTLSKNQIKQKRAFIEEVAGYVRQLHTKGIYPTDLKTTNIFVEETSTEKRTFWLIDLDQVFFLKRVSKRRRIKNIGQINTSVPGHITLTDRLRFYHHYTGKKQLEHEDKKIIRAIIRLSWKRNPHWHPRFGMDARLIRNWE